MIFTIREVLPDKTVEEQELYVYAEDADQVVLWANSHFNDYEITETPIDLITRVDCHVDLAD